MSADPRRIHELEFELGFRDDPPPPRRPSDAPGSIIEYRPIGGRPEWTTFVYLGHTILINTEVWRSPAGERLLEMEKASVRETVLREGLGPPREET